LAFFSFLSGRALESAAPQPGDWKQLRILNEQRGIRIDARTAATRWGGDGSAALSVGNVSMQRTSSA
jgi:hypothetical protein